ncbi:MAG: hypothetical protein M1829_000369 [Trizodia sp. TS-e1964]|nr:MAG: hypothetical protein M1829_000369 [Trizodia sp. TS-e1964]
MEQQASEGPSQTIPVLLLKNSSTPSDAYDIHFRALSTPTAHLEPQFVPVLDHSYKINNLNEVCQLLIDRAFTDEGPEHQRKYAGLIFTSQRAVEGFARLVAEESEKQAAGFPFLREIPLYTVGPATTRGLEAIPSPTPLNVLGGESGNGATLARFILQHYNAIYPPDTPRLPLLFLAGEKRLDVIPSILSAPENLADSVYTPKDRISVTELVVYDAMPRASFKEEFAVVLAKCKPKIPVWVVVFSPSGCDTMVECLRQLDQQAPDRRVFVATIGPTTRDHLRRLSFEPDVCAAKPTPEKLAEGILEFMFQKDHL